MLNKINATSINANFNDSRQFHEVFFLFKINSVDVIHTWRSQLYLLWLRISMSSSSLRSPRQ